MRGKRLAHVPESPFCRIIPARAGQTRCRSGNILYPPDHPRACGANLASRRFHNGLSGSSPRVRGKPSLRPSMIRGFRIIPARAGQTRPVSLVGLPAPDHPRACGANMVWSSSFRSLAGSSPRVRGKQETQLRPRYWGRIIPARAGQTQRRVRRSGHSADHPRACGANQVDVAPFEPVPGSSPRVRGKRERGQRRRGRIRIIPARAGQTGGGAHRVGRGADHPRACGANTCVHD